eukprot:TRINITY_DN2856_c0_g1_i1.p1 TRINITY_DN2856_c0_g1~~TRINITY_DN2856_c0_g1_i1.p1  ORF type:complete len:453 (-),score=58.09 TRINITY_DN2856_c0_g1_i1:22-1380(-)
MGNLHACAVLCTRPGDVRMSVGPSGEDHERVSCTESIRRRRTDVLRRGREGLDAKISRSSTIISVRTDVRTFHPEPKITLPAVDDVDEGDENWDVNTPFVAKPTAKRKTLPLVVDCDFEEYLFGLLPERLQIEVLRFAIDALPVLSCVSSTWYLKMRELLRRMVQDIDRGLRTAYEGAFVVKRSSFRRVDFTYRGTKYFRLDRVYDLEVTRGAVGGPFLLNFGYSYRPHSTSTSLIAEYAVELLPEAETKTFWLYKDEMDHNYDEDGLATAVPVQAVRQGQAIRFAVNVYNPQEMLDVPTVKWLPMIAQQTIAAPATLRPKDARIAKVPSWRFCELEFMIDEWDVVQSSEQISMEINTKMGKWLELKEHLIAGAGVTYERLSFICRREGKVEDSLQLFGCEIVILPRRNVTVDVVRCGGCAERSSRVELCVGDRLFIYFARSGGRSDLIDVC